MFDVVIVEDDPMVAIINKQYVMNYSDFRVCGEFRDGLSALDYLRKSGADLLILDQYMPRMNGLELLRQIRREGIPVQVIMVTAANDAPSVEEALRLGIVDYLVKPFSNYRFNQALEVFLTRMGTFSGTASFNQKMIDDLLGTSSNPNVGELPKGIQAATLEKIRSFLKNSGSIEMTGEKIADEVGVSRVTVRHYTNYLVERGELAGRLNYETGGRPSMMYRYLG